MKFYSFGNFYLQSAQSGIQAFHAGIRMSIKYISLDGAHVSPPYGAYIDWAKNSETIILLNGGAQSDLEEFEAYLSSVDHDYPWASFRESVEALNGALTNVSIILPERLYGNRDKAEFLGIIVDINGKRKSDCVDFVMIDNSKRIEIMGDAVGNEYLAIVSVERNEIVERLSFFDAGLIQRFSKCRLL